MDDTSDDRVIFAAVAQGQIDDISKSGVFKWRISEPYASLLKAAQLLRLRGSEISLIALSSECKLNDWSEARTVWRESRESGKLDWHPAAERIIRRGLREVGLEIATGLKTGLATAIDPQKILASANAQLGGLLDGSRAYNPTPSFHYREGVMGQAVYSTGLKGLDDLLFGGIWSQALIGVGLPSGHGKSTLAYTLLANACKQGLRCCLFTFESSTVDAVARILSALTGLTMGICISKECENQEQQDLLDAGLDILDSYLSIYDSTFNNPTRIEAVLRMERPILAVIDHLGMIDPASANKSARMSDPAGDLADAALTWSMKYSMTVVLNTQFSNSISAELKKKHDLNNTEFFGSSRVYNALDFAIIGLRHWFYPDTAYLRLKKNRKTGVVDIDVNLAHNPYTQSYRDIRTG